ncbi:unnamed protein product, partial [Heterosigma akashiwo]
MAYSQVHDYYLPAFYILMSHKSEDDYTMALQSFISAMNWNLNVLSISVDFEKALIKAVKMQFREAFIMGCLFHFKQAIRRRLLKLGVSKSKVKESMVRGGPVDWLTVMPLDEIEEKGIAFVKANFDCRKFSSEFEAFWGYFRDEWLGRTDPHTWNLTVALSCEEPLKAMVTRFRTNNALERFNRILHSLFSTRPNVVLFAEKIRAYSQEVVVELQRIQGKRSKPAQHSNEGYVPELPAEYASFK